MLYVDITGKFIKEDAVVNGKNNYRLLWSLKEEDKKRVQKQIKMFKEAGLSVESALNRMRFDAPDVLRPVQ